MNKKIVSLILGLGLAAMMATTLGACNQEGGGGEGASPGASPEASPTGSPEASPTTSP